MELQPAAAAAQEAEEQPGAGADERRRALGVAQQRLRREGRSSGRVGLRSRMVDQGLCHLDLLIFTDLKVEETEDDELLGEVPEVSQDAVFCRLGYGGFFQLVRLHMLP